MTNGAAHRSRAHKSSTPDDIAAKGCTSKNLVPLLEVEGLTKHYPSFSLEDVSFRVEPGRITGLIGRNGAGKSTTLKCLEGAVRPDDGTVTYFGAPFEGHETTAKQQIGFELGGADFYRTKRVSDIAAVTQRFYESWDPRTFTEYCELFSIDTRKRVRELSQGMCVKFVLALALSHRCRLLILDEPTSGLDPASRDEVLDIFLTLARKANVGILFSTHITSDLEKCADDIIHIEDGRVVEAGSMNKVTGAYRIAPLNKARADKAEVLGVRLSVSGDTALVPAASGIGRPATLDDIMTHTHKSSEHEEAI